MSNKCEIIIQKFTHTSVGKRNKKYLKLRIN